MHRSYISRYNMQAGISCSFSAGHRLNHFGIAQGHFGLFPIYTRVLCFQPRNVQYNLACYLSHKKIIMICNSLVIIFNGMRTILVFSMCNQFAKVLYIGSAILTTIICSKLSFYHMIGKCLRHIIMYCS